LLAALPIWQQTHRDVEQNLVTVDAETLRHGMNELA